MKFEFLKDKNIYLSPYNKNTEEFFDAIKNHKDINFLGYIDSFKEEKNIIRFNEVSNNCDYIIVISPNYFYQIRQLLLINNINNKKIIFLYFNSVQGKIEIFTKSLFKYFLNLKYLKIEFFFKKYLSISYLKLLRYKNIHKNKRAFILGNGPSLIKEDILKLNGEITFAANKIFLIFNEISWQPTYYFVVDNLVYEQNFDSIQELKLIKFFSIDMLKDSKKIQNGIYFNVDRSMLYPNLPTFGTSPILGFHKGYTVAYAMIQFAVYMGIKEIYYIGMDFTFSVPESENKLSKSVKSNGEINHFHKEYRKKGEKWNKPNMNALENSFTKIKQYCKMNDIKVYNASRGGKLDVLERVDFDKLF